MTTRQLLKEISTQLQSLGILASADQAIGFLKAWQDEDQEVIECLADCVSNHPEWLYGWTQTGCNDPYHCGNFNWLLFLMLENKPMLAVDCFCIWRETEFTICETALSPA